MTLVVFDVAKKASLALLACLLVLVASPVSAASKRGGKAWFGVAMARSPGGGLMVEHVFPASPAERMKITPGDVLVRADQLELEAPNDLVEHVRLHEPGMSVEVVVRRGGEEKPLTVVLEEYPGDEEVQRLMHVGKAAYPSFGVTAVQGTFPELSSLQGRVVIVDFFANWCASCKVLAPQLARWHERFKSRGLTVLGLTSDEEETARETIRNWKIPFAVGSDPLRRTESMYRVGALPSLFFIDRRGIIREVRVGYDPVRRASFEKLIEKLLAERAEP
jgi:peroxiredoxin